MKKIFKKLYRLKNLDIIESYKLFNNIIYKNINYAEIVSAIVLMKSKGETIYEILGAIKSFLKIKKKFNRPKYLFSDITGTGGDYQNDINISTISAIVSSIAGFKISKHCNYNITSKSGSADFLKENKININISAKHSRKNLDKFNICFLLAPLYYKCFNDIKNIRKDLKTRTIFNILGPLLNPSRPPLSVIGVYDIKLMPIIIRICKILNYKRVIVLHSKNYDEVTLYGPTYINELKNKKILKYKLFPEDFGFKKYNKKIKFSDKKHVKKLIKGFGKNVHEETISANVAMILRTFGKENIKDNAHYALEIIKKGEIYKFIKKISCGNKK
ncbi:anthranilate phosphoribosyltransferase [Buchnera aphidicola (Ceratoglyphina bambusae)]|uniref:anthranilate phosphoribosyltransferase n=1 Tax=Buchnera aphidicola TaxID=9 RepID=UPI0031B86375